MKSRVGGMGYGALGIGHWALVILPITHYPLAIFLTSFSGRLK
ncbi:MAG: hypothetical protein VKL59_18380 [Nostocaceae cyanobacterium]|nr:hypothetical protein [Nostocaceae cyanobacterium]